MKNYQKYIHNYLAIFLLMLSVLLSGCSAEEAENTLRQGAEFAREVEKILNEPSEQEYDVQTIDLKNIP